MSTQNPALGWFHGRWQKAYERIDKDRISRWVATLEQAHPDESREALAMRSMRRAARASAAAGVISSSPALIPFVGFAVSLVGIVPEEIYLIRRKCAMVLEIAAIYGFEPAQQERLYEIIALVENSPRMIQELMTAKEDVGRVAARALAGMSRTASRGAAFGARTASRGVVRKLPAVGLLAGGAINYYAFSVLGKRATRFYGQRREQESSTRLLAEGSEE